MQYNSYKKSSIDWVEEIPSHWTDIAIKYTVRNQPAEFIDGDWIESNVITEDGIRYLTTGNVGALRYKEQGNGFISEETFEKLNCTEVFPGDLLISRLNEPIARTCIVPDLGYRIVVAVDNVIYRPNKELYDKRYIMYQMNCTPYSEKASFMARGSTMHRISRSMLGGIKLCIPSLQEQNAIANYLDNKCSKIDNVIATQEKRVELLRELKQSIITRAVTRGINPNAKMKDSGVEWIGEIPEHWEVSRLKLLCKSPLMYGANESAEEYQEELPRYIRITDIDEKGNLREEVRKSLSKDKAHDYILNKGDLLFARSGATVGKTYLFNEDFLACFAGYLIKAELDKIKCSPEFVLRYTQSSIYENWKNSIFIQSTIQNIGADKYNELLVTLPPLSEQQAIVTHIEQQTSKLDSSITKALRQIELLKEYKQALITEVVTGKRKVI